MTASASIGLACGHLNLNPQSVPRPGPNLQTYGFLLKQIRNPYRAITFMVNLDGFVEWSDNVHYIGMDWNSAKASLTSTMRYWDERIQDNEYPEVIECEHG